MLLIVWWVHTLHSDCIQHRSWFLVYVPHKVSQIHTLADTPKHLVRILNELFIIQSWCDAMPGGKGPEHRLLLGLSQS